MNFFDLFKSNSRGDVAQGNEATQQAQTQCETQKPQNAETRQPAEDTERKEIGDQVTVHNLIILDESGSMQCIYRPALSGVNETLQTIRSAQDEHTTQLHRVTLVAFDSRHYNEIYHNVAANQAIDITDKQYRPNACTPLYDAMGRAINELRPNVKSADVVLVTIITDGYENASREYNGQAIKALVEDLRKQGWVFTYIGANQDVEAVAASMSINNYSSFKADADGTDDMFSRENDSRKRFYAKVACCASPQSRKDLEDNYF